MQRSVMGLIYLIQGMQSAGIDLTDRLDQIGIRPEALDPNGLIHRDLEWTIQSYLTEDYDPDIGLLVGQQYSLSGYGPYLMLLLTSSDVERALREAIEFQLLTYLFGTLKAYYDVKKLIVRYEPIHDDKLSLRTNAEIAGTYKFINDIYHMLGLKNIIINVQLSLPEPKQSDIFEKYKMYYGENVEFDCEQTRFICEADILKQTLSTADSVMHAVYKKKCIEEIERLGFKTEQSDDLIVKITNYLKLQNGVIPKMNDIAIALSIPERTMRHKLGLLQTNFKKIREEFIKQKAERLLLNQHMTIEEIAEALGYSEASAFNHSFKKWFGESPKQYLQKIEHKNFIKT